MVDRRLERSAARAVLTDCEREEKAARKLRKLRILPAWDEFDVVLNASAIDTEQMAAIIRSTVETLRVGDAGYM